MVQVALWETQKELLAPAGPALAIADIQKANQKMKELSVSLCNLTFK